MATETEKVAANQQRAAIPLAWQMEFQTWSDDALLSLNEDGQADPEIRAYAGWEFDYRIAFGKTALPVKELPKADRSRWTMAGAEATIRHRMEEQDQRLKREPSREKGKR